MEQKTVNSTYNPGRLAGCLYLLIGFSMVRPLFITGRLILRDDAAATARNIATHNLLFRFGIVSDVLAGIGCLLTALALYQLLKEVHRPMAVLMVFLGGLMPCTIDCLNTLNDLAALLAATGADFLSAFTRLQQAELAMLFLRVHEYGFVVNEIFAGLWLFPFGMLVYRSRFIPRLIGAGLVVNGFAYLAISFTGLLAPDYVDRITRIVSPALLGEGAVMLWLLVKGARPEPLRAAASN